MSTKTSSSNSLQTKVFNVSSKVVPMHFHLPMQNEYEKHL